MRSWRRAEAVLRTHHEPRKGRVTSGGDLTEEEHEVTLSTETPFIEKDVVAKQRVRLDKDTVTEEAQVDESVRKEQIDTGGDTDAQR